MTGRPAAGTRSATDDQMGMIYQIGMILKKSAPSMSRVSRERFLEEIARRLPPEPCDLEIRLAIERRFQSRRYQGLIKR